MTPPQGGNPAPSKGGHARGGGDLNTEIFHNDGVKLAARALAAGAVRKSLMRLHWDCAGRCEAPFSIIYLARPEGRTGYHEWSPGKSQTLEIEIDYPCRRCGPCLRRRAREWAERASYEIAQAQRTWFVTLTLAPKWHEYFRLHCVDDLARRGVVWERLPEHEQFSERHKRISPDLTKFFKRVRKRSGCKLRYLLVAEAHKQQQCGLPHYHALMHECSGTLLKKHFGFRDDDTLSASWPYGFASAKLIETETNDKPAWYVCKYLSKDARARVRASQAYGGAVGPSSKQVRTDEVNAREANESARVKKTTTETPNTKTEMGFGSESGSREPNEISN